MNYTLPILLLISLVAACTTGVVTNNATEDGASIPDDNEIQDTNGGFNNDTNGMFDENQTGMVDNQSGMMNNETDGMMGDMMDGNQTERNLSRTGPQGTLAIGITDALVRTSNLESLMMSVDNVRVHSDDGWISLSGSSEVDLLELADDEEVALLTSESVPEGSYDAISFEISSVEVEEDTTGTQRNGSMEAVLPSSEVVLDLSFDVSENETTAVTLDFLADESVHTTTDDEFVFAPVIRATVEEDARVNEDGDTLEISGGTMAADERFEMDIEGEMNGTGIAEDAELTISGGEVMDAEEEDDDNTTDDNDTDDST